MLMIYRLSNVVVQPPLVPVSFAFLYFKVVKVHYHTKKKMKMEFHRFPYKIKVQEIYKALNTSRLITQKNLAVFR